MRLQQRFFLQPYMVNLLIAGFNPEEQGSLHYMDYLASSVKVPFAAHGYGSYFVLSLLDRWHHADLSQTDAVTLLKKCMGEVSVHVVFCFIDSCQPGCARLACHTNSRHPFWVLFAGLSSDCAITMGRLLALLENMHQVSFPRTQRRIFSWKSNGESATYRFGIRHSTNRTTTRRPVFVI